jgi:hypothetical protein
MTLSPQRLDKAAKSAYLRNRYGTIEWKDVPEEHRQEWRERVAEVISAYLGDAHVDVPRELTKETLDRAVAFALTVTIGGKYNWSAYMADLYRLMLSAELTERDAG